MIQRIQSLFLLIAAIIPIILLFMPYGYYTIPDAQYVFTSLSLKLNTPGVTEVELPTYYIALCLVTCSVLTFIALFSYKNRTRQTQIVSLTMIVFLVTLLLMLWVCPDIIFKKHFISKGVFDVGQQPFQFNYWILIFVIQAICLYLANRFIKKDEALVRSADRLR